MEGSPLYFDLLFIPLHIDFVSAGGEALEFNELREVA